MIETIEERKKQIADYYEKEYAPKPKKWWWGNAGISYESIREIYKRRGGPRHEVIETIIRNNKKGAAISAALFLLFSSTCWINPDVWKSEDIIITAAIIGTMITLSLKPCFDRRVKIAMGDCGIYTLEWKGSVRWQNIAAVYIKEDNTGDNFFYYLVVHFYDPAVDEFRKKECDLTGLEESPENIACFIYQYLVTYTEIYNSHYEEAKNSELLLAEYSNK